MWSAISKIFAKNCSSRGLPVVEEPPDEMDRGERRGYSETDDGFTTKQAKQRASIKWLLSKAFNNKVPENIKEPFYKDHENQEHLKPQILGALANAEVYCRALANIYSDPNYHNLNHSAILQTLARKGAFGADPANGAQLTETALIQTNPLRMGAHMAVAEAIMLLYAREVVTADRVQAAVQRFSHGRATPPPPATTPDHERDALLWVRHACDALGRRIERETAGRGMTNGGDGDRLEPPDFPPCRDLEDLCDGAGLAALVAYYCPDELHWAEIRASAAPSVQDSLHNLRLVRDFCARCLPAPIFHLQPEDVAYLRESMKLNLVVFVADLFNVMEIHPASCVRDKFTSDGFPTRNAHGVVHKRNLLQPVVTPIPDLRSGLDDSSSPAAFQVSKSAPTHAPLRKTNSFQQSQQTLASEFSEDSLRRGSDESFVVHKGRGVPTLRSVASEEPLMPARLKVSKERQNNDSKADERGEMAAGKPSNWEENRKTTYAGRRSRRNSVTDDSQLTIENFGGSQDNLNFIGRNPDKEVAVHVGRKISAPSFPVAAENAPVRSSLQDARGSFRLGYDNGCEEKQDDGSEKAGLKRQMSSDDITLKSYHKNRGKESLIEDLVDTDAGNRMSFADLGRQKVAGESKGIHLVYMNDREDCPSKSSFLSKLGGANGNAEKKTSFAALPNTTTWQQQVSSAQAQESAPDGGGGAGNVLSSQLNDIRLKLEEKRRHIESEKRRMEVAMNKQRQKVGKAAFLQAVTKGRGNLLKSPTSDPAEPARGSTDGENAPSEPAPAPKPQRPFTLQEITADASVVEKKWLGDGQPFVEARKTPDLENMDLEQYQQSLAQMNSSLSDIQSDIQRLAAEQNQMQAQHQQKLIAEQQRQIMQLQQQQFQSMQPPPPPPPQHQYYQPQHSFALPLQPSSSAPHLPQSLYAQSRVPEQPQFFLHDDPPPAPAATPQRRTWGQPPPQARPDGCRPQPELRTWGGKPQPAQEEGGAGGFLLHRALERFQDRQDYREEQQQNGGDRGRALNHSNSFTLSQQHHHHQYNQNQYGTSHSTPSASPQHRGGGGGGVHRQISQLLDDAVASKRPPVALAHAPVAAPPADDMEPQNISFIGNGEEDAALTEGLGRLNITSGTRTYRVPSPTRPLLLSRSSPFRPATPPPEPDGSLPGEAGEGAQKGFYISFDDEQPKRPKPPLRAKRGSPKKERSYVEDPAEEAARRERLEEKKRQLERELEDETSRREESARRERAKREASRERQKVAAASAIIIGNELSNPDPDLIDERERKKEKIMMLSLQRRQRQEEAKARKEAEAQRRREAEKAKEEEKARRKEEQAARRAAILERYKLKKAIEEADREGKTPDRQEPTSLKPAPKMRAKGAARPRPKTIHIDSGSVQLAEGMSPGGRGRKGSTSNLAACAPSSAMKRDYYRGSHDSLAERSMSNNVLYKDSPDDGRGTSPCHGAASQTLGRRSSYKTSRGSSFDQDSPACCRFGDTDSGLGRATPPRRAPSPGPGPQRPQHARLASPSGPGSLPPGLATTRGRRAAAHAAHAFDDGSSDVSSTPSSMTTADYTGPRLYKQPATKSNRSIVLNAVEYCVFPGAVNREAKRRVLEEIGRSEGKHFLILFRDAGCQFRALYSYCPDEEVVAKLYGTGPRLVNDRMFDKFFKYNSGGKCFSQIHTKHLTVTIDAFTIHNSLWQGKKVNLPSKKDMALVI